jgi:CheY-like chemotaxis protein
LQILRERHFDCMVLDLGLPDMSGFEFINRLRNDLHLVDVPVVVYTGRDLSRKEESELKRIADAIIVKDVRSPERLLDETALFLHRVEANLPVHKRQILEQLHESDPVLAGKTALIVDDDMRNIYALTSLLERHKMNVLYAESGAEGIEQLRTHRQDIDVVLMDVMMPEMDGYEAMRRVRDMEEFRNLPMIALTAKAMKGDREKCMDAGASDYITKPIDAQQLVSLLRVWLYR